MMMGKFWICPLLDGATFLAIGGKVVFIEFSVMTSSKTMGPYFCHMRRHSSPPQSPHA